LGNLSVLQCTSERKGTDVSAQTRTLLIVAAGLLVGLILLVVIALSVWSFGFHRPLGARSLGPMRGPFNRFGGQYQSNGERIYFTATSRSGQPIVPDIQGMHPMMGGMMGCVTCHGPDGRGGQVSMMMSSFEAPDIRYATLTGGEHHEEGKEHPAYTDETIKRAITQGLDPAEEPLDWQMPRWQMSDQDLNDLLDYLKTLD
jgi:cytochrome c oxidase subunit 2